MGGQLPGPGLRRCTERAKHCHAQISSRASRKRPNIRFGSVRFGNSVFFGRFGSVRFGRKFWPNHRIFWSKNAQKSGFFMQNFSIISRKLYGFQCQFRRINPISNRWCYVEMISLVSGFDMDWFDTWLPVESCPHERVNKFRNFFFQKIHGEHRSRC